MSIDRIQDGFDSSYRAGRINPGDLVVVNDDFIGEAFYSELKDFPGIVTNVVQEDEVPMLLEVYWCDGAVEVMYEDELEMLNKGGNFGFT